MKVNNHLAVGLVLLLSLFLFSSCLILKPIELIGIDSVTVERIHDGKVDLNVGLKINNPNKNDIAVKGYSITVFYDDIRLGTMANESEFALIPASTSTYIVPVQIDTEELLKNKKKLLGSLLTTGNTFRFQGNIKVGTFLMSKDIVIDHTADVELFRSLMKELGLDSFRSKKS